MSGKPLSQRAGSGADAVRFALTRPQWRPPATVELDPDQQRVVAHSAGLLRVLAGPGTGKTTTLVEAVVDRVVRQAVPVEELLLLTFSRAAAGDLRDRVTSRLQRTISEPVARTFHSYAFGLLRQAAVLRGDPVPRLLSSSEQDVTLRELLEGRLETHGSEWPVELAAAVRTRAFVDELADLLMRAVERDVQPETLRTMGFLQGRSDWIAAAGILEEYLDVTALKSPGAFDAPELIQRALGELRSNDQLLNSERRKRRRIFVDEYQDADPAQIELLRLIATGADEMIVIGDPDQSIYAFRGAEPYAMSDIESTFDSLVPGGFASVSLSMCRRSGPNLLAATRRIAARLPGPVDHRRLRSAADQPDLAPEVAVFSSTSQEAAFLATALRRAHFTDGVPWSEMAVLTRSAGPVQDSLRRGLAVAGVPVGRSGTGTLTDEPLIARLIGLLRCVARPQSVTAEVAEDLLIGIGNADPLQLTRIQRYLRRFPSAPADLADLVREPAVVAFLPPSLRGPADRVRAVVSAGDEALTDTASAEEVLWRVWRATGLSERLERRSLGGGADGARADRDLDAVLALFHEAATVSDRTPGGGVQQLYEWVEGLQITDSAVRERQHADDAVAILTAHSSKGLEWTVVCLAGVQEGVWPNLRQRGSLLGADRFVDVVAERPAVASGQLTERLNEERRLFYVAATRARRRLLVTAIATDDTQPSVFLDELEPSEVARPVRSQERRFVLSGMVAELRAALVDPAVDDSDRQAAAHELARLAQAGVAPASPASWWGIAPPSSDRPIRSPEDGPVPIRPSRFDTYLDCELKALLGELGAVDASDHVAASLGTLVHAVAEQAPDGATVEDLRQLLEAGWSRLEFAAPWQGAAERERAEQMLGKLAGWLASSRSELSLVAREAPFAVVIDDVELAGKVDRLERDGEDRLVVIDFKTGKTKPSNEKVVEHPQLATYQLAAASGAFDDPQAQSAGSASLASLASSGAGGARLVQLGAGTGAVEQRQPALQDLPDPDWVRVELARIASVLRGNFVTARVGPACNNCKVKLNCPAQLDGRAVTG